MGRRISKEFLHPSILEGVNNKIGNLDSLETDAKGNMVQAINELVEKLDNSAELEVLEGEIADGKELIANAVGEPLTAEESFDEMSNDINSLLSTFKTNMMNNGVTVESGDKFKALIDKIATMVEEGEGKGIQFASGTGTVVSKPELSSNGDFIEVDSLSFKPTIILAHFDENTHVFFDSTDTANGNGDGYFLINSGGMTRTTLDDNSVVNNSGFRLWIYGLSREGLEYNWVAIGVGEEDTTLRDSLASILTEEGVDVTEEDDMASLISKVDTEFDNRITMKTGTLNYTNGLVGENNNEKIIITHNLGTIPSYIICRTSVMDYMPDGSSVGRNFTGSLCLTIDNSSYITANGNEATLSITDITENTFTVLTTMGTSGRLSGWIEEWIVMK